MSYASDLVSRWRREADELEQRHGAMEAAQTARSLAAELEAADRRWWTEEIPAKEAARLRGVNVSTVYKWKREGLVLTRARLLGEIENVKPLERERGRGGDPVERVIAMRMRGR